MNRRLFLLIVLSIFSTSDSNDCHRLLAATDKQSFKWDSTDFALKFYKTTRQLAKNDSTNVILSPASVSLGLGMVLVGTRGSSKSEILHVLMPNVSASQVYAVESWLNSGLNAEGMHYELYTGNGAFLDGSLSVRDQFLVTLQECFHSDLETKDFVNQPEKARQEINKWVEDQTNEKIKDLIPPDEITQSTRFVLANAIYFKADWEKPFITENGAGTKDGPFYPLLPTNKKVVQNVKFMSMGSDFLYHKDEDVQVLGIPYKDNELTMFIFLPSGSLKEFEETLGDGGRLSELMGKAEMHFVMVKIPKFKMTRDVKLIEALQKLGIRKIFDISRADFIGITTTNTKLYISAAFHKAFIEV